MAQSAIDPVSGERKDIEWFAKNRIDVGGCEVCGNPMARRAKFSEDVSKHFAHASKGTGCPTIPQNRVRYEDLPPSGYDPANGERIKLAVKENLLALYYKTGFLADGAITTKLFQSLIEKANEKNAWAFVGLRLEFVPYMLVCMHDGEYEIKRFNKQQKKLVPAKFFMALEPGVRHLDDLWNKPTQIKQKIWRVFPSQQLIEELLIEGSLPREPHWFAAFQQRIAKTLRV